MTGYEKAVPPDAAPTGGWRAALSIARLICTPILAVVRRCSSRPAFLIISLFVATVAPSDAQQRDHAMQTVSELPLVGDDGQRVANHRVALPEPIDQWPGVVVAANPGGSTTLTEFYDLNCPYCRIASTDIADMVDLDTSLRLVLVPFPVLGVASIAASRVELAVAKLGSAEQFFAFHHAIYAERGVADGARALAVAQKLGFDQAALVRVGDSDAVTQIMQDHFRMGNALGLAATPSFIIDGVAILGYPGRYRLQAIVDNASSCGKVLC